MAEPNTGSTSLDGRRRGTGRHATGSFESAPPESGPTSSTPCGACKFLRRKCVNGCIFAPYFSSDQGAALFAAVHKVFGASNMSKLLMHIPVHQRHHAALTISYEAQARLSDPVYGCVSTVLALQQQVATLQTELAMVQNELMNNRLAVANGLLGFLQQTAPVHHLVSLQPVYSNASSASHNNVINMSNLDSSPNNFAGEYQSDVLSRPNYDTHQLSKPCREGNDDYEENSGDALAFAVQILHPG